MAYVYAHVRKDTGNIFYVGISNDDEKHSRYDRAYSKDRNDYWNEITRLTEYDIVFLHKDVDIEFAKEKELELINKLGTIEKGGLLANRNAGSKGTHWCKPEGERKAPIVIMVKPKNKDIIKAKIEALAKKLDK